jgi:plastocyanin
LFPNVSPGARNHHPLIPYEVTIKAGGAVNFVISGLHQVVVYGDGTQPANINVSNTIPGTGASPSAPRLIDDPNNRVYRGLDPFLQSRDRIEIVQFPNPGSFLVICAVLQHFNEGMFGFVTVFP